MPEVRFQNQAGASIFSRQKVISLKVDVHILFAVKGVFLNDLEPMLFLTDYRELQASAAAKESQVGMIFSVPKFFEQIHYIHPDL